MELLTFEWRRARSIRTTWITSLFVILGALFFAFLGTVSVVDEDGTALRLPATDLIKTAVVDNPIAMVLIASLGAMAFGHEYRYGTIRLTLTAFPVVRGLLRQVRYDCGHRARGVCDRGRRVIRSAARARRGRTRRIDLGAGGVPGRGIRRDLCVVSPSRSP